MTRASHAILTGILGLAAVALALSAAVMQGEMAQLRRAASADNLDYKHAVGRLARCEAAVAVIKAAAKR